MAGCGRSNRARATASWSRSPRASDAVACCAWTCSGRRWRRSGCASGCTPARCSCATRATTSARRSTAPRGCVIWRMAARRCCRARPSRLVVDQLPAGAWLTDLGSHPLRDLPPPGAGGAAVSSRSSQRVPAAAHTETVACTESSGAADELRWPRARKWTRCGRPVGREPAGDPDRCGWGGQDPPGGTGRGRDGGRVRATACGMWIWRRSPTPSWCRSRWPARWACPISRAAPRWTRCCGLSRDRQMLVVLDNCEHLLDASADWSSLSWVQRRG